MALLFGFGLGERRERRAPPPSGAPSSGAQTPARASTRGSWPEKARSRARSPARCPPPGASPRPSPLATRRVWRGILHQRILHQSGLRPLWWSIPSRCCAPGRCCAPAHQVLRTSPGAAHLADAPGAAHPVSTASTCRGRSPRPRTESEGGLPKGGRAALERQRSCLGARDLTAPRGGRSAKKVWTVHGQRPFGSSARGSGQSTP